MTNSSQSSGQVLMVAILAMALLLLTIPVLIGQQYYAAHFGLHSQQFTLASEATEAGLAQAVSQLSSSSDDWQRVLQLDPAILGSSALGFDGIRRFNPVPNASYTIQCSTGNTNLSSYDLRASTYQIRVIVKGYTQKSDGSVAVGRALEALIGPRTVGAEFSTERGAPAALELFQSVQLGTGGDLDVEWGPVVSYAPLNVTLTSMNTGHHPRKYSTQSIAPFNNAPGGNPADDVEYWTYQNLGSPSQVNVASMTNVATPDSPPPMPGDSYNSAYRLNASTTVVIINGDLTLDVGASLDVNALVVMGNLTITGTTGGQNLLPMRVPPTAALEYPTTPTVYPCSTAVANAYNDGSKSCNSTDLGVGGFTFRGFLYVHGNLIIQDNATVNMAGAVRVGDLGTTTSQLQIGNNATLRIFYDDSLNHTASTAPFLLWREDVVSVPVS